jgi:hypothetical protein
VKPAKTIQRRSTSTHHYLAAERQIQQYTSQLAPNILLIPDENFKNGRRAGDNATFVVSKGRT